MKKSTLSFSLDEDEEEAFRVVKNAPKTNIAISKNAMKHSYNQFSTKTSRRSKIDVQSIQDIKLEDDFISLDNENNSKIENRAFSPVESSRLDMDWNKKKDSTEFHELCEEEDEEVLEWEKKIVSSAKASFSGKKSSVVDFSKKAVKKEDMPVVDVPEKLKCMLNELKCKYSENSSLSNDKSVYLSRAKESLNASEEKLGIVNRNIEVIKNLKEFMIVFADFYDEKIREIQEMEELFVQNLSSRSLIYPHCSTPSSFMSALESTENFEYKNLEFSSAFSEVSEQFNCLSNALSPFKQFEVSLPDLFISSYMDLQVAKISEIYVREEISFWNPFATKISFHLMNWFLTIQKLFPSSSTKIITEIIGSLIVQKFQKTTFDPFSVLDCSMLLFYWREFGDYLEEAQFSDLTVLWSSFFHSSIRRLILDDFNSLSLFKSVKIIRNLETVKKFVYVSADEYSELISKSLMWIQENQDYLILADLFNST